MFANQPRESLAYFSAGHFLDFKIAPSSLVPFPICQVHVRRFATQMAVKLSQTAENGVGKLARWANLTKCIYSRASRPRQSKVVVNARGRVREVRLVNMFRVAMPGMVTRAPISAFSRRFVRHQIIMHYTSVSSDLGDRLQE